MDIKVSNKQFNPAVIHTEQFSNGEYKVVFKFDDYVQNGVDLRNKKVYVITSYYGTPNIIEVTSTVVGSKLEVNWDINSDTLANDGVVLYQLRFSESGEDGTTVWYSYKGLLIVRESIDADNFTSANYPTLLQQIIDKIERISGELEAAVFYMEPGESIPVVERTSNRLYYQIVDNVTNEGYFEDHTGKKLGCYEVEYVTDPNLDSLLNDGEYVCYFTSGSISYGFLKVCKSHSCDRIFQYFQYIEGNTCRIKSRVITVSGTSVTTGAWSEMATRLDAANEIATYNAGLLGATNVPVCVDGSGKLAPASVTNTELGYLSGVTSGVQSQLNGKQASITGAATTVTSTNLTASRALVSNTSGKIAASSVTNTELGYLSGVTSKIQTQLDEKQFKITGAASTITGTTLAKSMALVSNSDGNVAVSNVTSTELGYLSGVTSDIQTQLNGKQATITGAATTIAISDLTASRVLISNASKKVAVSDITSTELGYLDGATSNIQNQLNTITNTMALGVRFLDYSSRSYIYGSYSDYKDLSSDTSYQVEISGDCMLFIHLNTGASDGTIEKVDLTIKSKNHAGTLVETKFNLLDIHTGTEMFSLPFESGSTLILSPQHNVKIKIIKIPFKS